MDALSIEEKVFLIECFYSRGKNYSQAYRGFRSKYGSKKVSSETILRRIIDNFGMYGTLNDRRHDLPGPSRTVTTNETIDDVRNYFDENPNTSIRKAAQVLDLKRETLRKIMRDVIKLHPYKITTHQLLTEKAMEKRVEFCKVESSKPKSSKKTEVNKKTETVEEKKSSNKKRENDVNDKPASKKAKVEIKESKDDKLSTAKQTKITKNEPKQMQNKTDTNLNEINFECTKTNNEGKKYNLKICTWNVSGLRAVLKKNGLDYIIKEDADIVALQETKCDKNKLPDEIKIPGYHHYFLESKKSGYCGVALFCKEKPISVTYGLNNNNFDDEGRIITAEFSEFFMINVYVPNAGQKLVTLPKRLEWNKALKKHVEELDKKKPVVICGDMNVAHQEIDLKNPKTNTKNAGFTKEERDGMTEFLAAGFVDTFRMLYPDQENAYTFWSYFANSRSKDIGWRLDYFLVSERIKNKVCDNVIRKQVYGSDHCPIILYLNV